MAHQRCLDFEGGDSDVLLSAFPHLALSVWGGNEYRAYRWCRPQIVTSGSGKPDAGSEINLMPPIELPQGAEMRQMALLPLCAGSVGCVVRDAPGAA
jgi:hypothetical protein